MTTEEFSNEFDTLLNSYSTTEEPTNTIELDEYEKSVFLTKAQEDVVIDMYNGKNIFGVDIIAPQTLGEIENLPIIISSQLAQESIRKQISDNYTNEIVTLY